MSSQARAIAAKAAALGSDAKRSPPDLVLRPNATASPASQQDAAAGRLADATRRGHDLLDGAIAELGA